jgi:hypothetical protein
MSPDTAVHPTLQIADSLWHSRPALVGNHGVRDLPRRHRGFRPPQHISGRVFWGALSMKRAVEYRLAPG